MAKDPAMLFYTSDFLTGAALLTMKERGQYITLLCLQQQMGHMRLKDMERAVGKLSEGLLAKFRADGEGRLYNLRAETEMEKRAAHCQLQRERVNKRWSSPGTAPALPLEAEDENRDENKNTGLTTAPPETGESEGAARVLAAYRDSIEPSPDARRIAALRSYTAALSPEAVCHAIEAAADGNKKSWSYIKAILLRYTAQGVKTAEDVRLDEERRHGRGASTAGASARPGINVDLSALRELEKKI